MPNLIHLRQFFSTVSLQGGGLEGDLEKPVEFLRVGRNQFPLVPHVSGHGGRSGGTFAGQQDLLEGVQLAESEGIEVLLQVAPEEPIVEEGRFLLVGEVGLDDPVEEFRVPLQEEEIQFVAGVLGILLALFIVLHAGPVEDELELTQGGIILEGEQEVVNVAQVVEYAQAGGRRVGQLEGLPRVHHRHALLL